MRIYRREEEKPDNIWGVVEEIGAEGKRAFENADDLWEILKSPRGDLHRKSKSKSRSGKRVESKGGK